MKSGKVIPMTESEIEAYESASAPAEKARILSGYIDRVRSLPKSDFCRDCGMCSALPSGPSLPSFTPTESKTSTFVQGYDGQNEKVREFWIGFVDREGKEPPDDWRELPRNLTVHYPEALRVLLDCGKISFDDLASVNEQIEAIEHLEAQGKWKDFPMMAKIQIFFGELNKQRIEDDHKKIKEKIEANFLDALGYTKLVEDELIHDHLTKQFRKVIRNE